MKINELRQKSKPELNRILQDLRDKLSQFRFQLATNKVKNVREIRQVRRDIARILTLLKQHDTNTRIDTNVTNNY